MSSLENTTQRKKWQKVFLYRKKCFDGRKFIFKTMNEKHLKLHWKLNWLYIKLMVEILITEYLHL